MVLFALPSPGTWQFSSYAPVRTFDGGSPGGSTSGGDGSGGQACSAFVADLRLALALNYSVHRDEERRKIIYASRFLVGRAWRWYLGLLFENVGFHQSGRPCDGAPAPRAMGMVSPERARPAYWASFPFVIPPLRSADAFFEALQEAFPDGEQVPGCGVDQYAMEARDRRPCLRRLSSSPVLGDRTNSKERAAAGRCHTPSCVK